MTKKVVIIGSALSGNKGAAAMLESSIQTISERLEDVEFTLLSMYQISDAALNEYPRLRVVDAKPLVLGLIINPAALLYKTLPFTHSFWKNRIPAVRALAEADILLDQGGITFVDGREKFLIYNVASILPALFMGTPVFKCAQALGPFNNPINRMAAKIFLPRVERIMSRGAITHEHLMGLGLKNVTAGADYAFSLGIASEEKKLAKKNVNMRFFKGGTVVGVSPSVVLQKKAETAGKDYARTMVTFIDRLTARGDKVLLLPHSVRSNSTKTHNNDMPLCKDIYEKLKDRKNILFIDKELSSQTLRYVIGECDYFIASRFHAMVSSLAMEVPTIVIGWSHKYEEVLGMFELEKWAFGQDNLTDDYLWRMYEQLVAEKDGVKALLAKNLPKVKKQSVKQADIIADLIK